MASLVALPPHPQRGTIDFSAIVVPPRGVAGGEKLASGTSRVFELSLAGEGASVAAAGEQSVRGGWEGVKGYQEGAG